MTKQKTITDFISFSGCPSVLERCKALASSRAVYEQYSKSPFEVDVFDMDISSSIYFAEQLTKHIDNPFDLLAQIVDEADFRQDATLSFNDCYQSLIEKLGIKMLDNLLHGEIDKFLLKLNENLAISGDWTLEPRGGYSGYRHSALLKVDDMNAGLVAWGAENFGFMISFSGVGCSHIDMHKLKEFIDTLPGAKITRVDIALDDLQGSYNVDTIKQMYIDNRFTTGGRAPKFQMIQSGELNQLTKSLDFCFGQTFYVGSRESGKMLRAYEKGKQLESEDYPNWVRFEVEIRSKNHRVIPSDVLINTDSYFVGSYPNALGELIKNVAPTKIKINRQVFKCVTEVYLKNARKQYGKFINFLNLVHCDTSKVVELMTKNLTELDIPDRLKIPVY